MRADLVEALGGLPRRVAVLRALQLGDLVCAVPALRALRRALPDAHVTLVGLPWAEAFATRFAHLVDGFAAFPGYPGLPEREADVHAVPPFLASMQGRAFDLVLQLHGRGDTSNAVVQLFGGRLTAGFHPAHGACPDPRTFRAWPEEGTEAERLLALTDFLGFARDGLAVEFPLLAGEGEEASALLAASGLDPSRLVLLHPGARMPSRRWPAERFAGLARALAVRGWHVAITGAGREEQEVCAAVSALAPGAANLHGRTSLGGLAALVDAARLVVCNDTGISHVAAGRGTPSVIVSCGADPARFAPAGRERHRVIHHPTPCRPCMHPVCPVGHPCATGIAVDEVLHAALNGLGGGPLAAPAAVALARSPA